MGNRDVNLNLRARDEASGAFRSASSRLAELRTQIEELRGKGQLNLTIGDTRNISRMTAEANRLERALGGLGTSGAQAATSLQGSLGQLGGLLSGAGLGGLTGLLGGAGIGAAAIQIGKTALELGNLGAQSITTKASFDAVMASVGASPALLNALQTAAGGTITDLRLMQLANTALAGSSAELGGAFASALPQLIEAARAANQLNPALGDTEFLFSSLVTGIKRGSPMLIDNTGITLKLGEANEKYAASLGKSADALTEEEKKLALLSATLDGADRLVQQAGGNLDNLTAGAQRATTAWGNFRAAVGEKLAPDVSAALAGLAGFLDTLTNIVSGKQAQIEAKYVVDLDLSNANQQLAEAEEGLRRATKEGTYLSGTAADWQNEVDKARVAVVEAEIAVQRLNGTLGGTGFEVWGDAGVTAALRVRDAALDAWAAMQQLDFAAATAQATSGERTRSHPLLVSEIMETQTPRQRWAAEAEKAKAAAEEAAAALERANTAAARDYAQKMATAAREAASEIARYLSEGQNFSIGLGDLRGGNPNAPGKNGAFEDIYRLQAWLNDGSWGDVGQKLAGGDKEKARKIVQDFQNGIFSPDVIASINVDDLAKQAQMMSLADKTQSAFVQALSDKSGASADIVGTLLGTKADKNGQSAAQTAATNAMNAMATNLGTAVNAKDFKSAVAKHGETTWAQYEGGFVGAARNSKALAGAIDAMVRNSLASYGVNATLAGMGQ